MSTPLAVCNDGACLRTAIKKLCLYYMYGVTIKNSSWLFKKNCSHIFMPCGFEGIFNPSWHIFHPSLVWFTQFTRWDLLLNHPQHCSLQQHCVFSDCRSISNCCLFYFLWGLLLRTLLAQTERNIFRLYLRLSCGKISSLKTVWWCHLEEVFISDDAIRLVRLQYP